VRYFPLNDETIGARGCGNQATYLKICRQVVQEDGIPGQRAIHTECKWAMDAAGVQKDAKD
jgi:hypothetical protein